MQALRIDDDLCIRPFDHVDTAAFVDAVRESESTVGAWMPWCTAAYTAGDAQAWFDQCATRLDAAQAYDLGIFSGDGMTLLGGVGINQINRQHNLGNLGYWVRQTRQRQGVAVRAAQAMTRYGFDTLKLTRIEIVAAVDNLASRGVAEKAGATFEGIARNRLIVFGQPRAAAVYSLVP